jgi:DNA-binding CsgD family transcriptional regulator
MTRSEARLLALLEATYRVELASPEWLRGIAEGCRSWLEVGFEVAALEFHQTELASEILRVESTGNGAHASRSLPSLLSVIATDVRENPYVSGLSTPTRELLESMWIVTCDSSGRGCALYASRPRVGDAARTPKLWRRIAPHLSGAVRLRQRLLGRASGILERERSAASRGDAIAAVRTAVCALEGARNEPSSPLGPSPSGLVEGPWSLLDEFTAGGRRFIVARQNEPSFRNVDALTVREGQILRFAELGLDNKTIAHKLGVEHSTVRVLVRRAALKFGVRRRTDLIRRYRDYNRSSESG